MKASSVSVGCRGSEATRDTRHPTLMPTGRRRAPRPSPWPPCPAAPARPRGEFERLLDRTQGPCQLLPEPGPLFHGCAIVRIAGPDRGPGDLVDVARDAGELPRDVPQSLDQRRVPLHEPADPAGVSPASATVLRGPSGLPIANVLHLHISCHRSHHGCRAPRSTGGSGGRDGRPGTIRPCQGGRAREGRAGAPGGANAPSGPPRGAAAPSARHGASRRPGR